MISKTKIFAISFLIVLADQLTKLYFKYNSLDLGILKLNFVKNYGAAFSILQGQRALLIAISIAALILIAYYFKELKEENISFYALTFLLAGTIGNLMDRIFLGYVVDFIDFGFFPVFNMADISNSLAAFLILMSLIKK